MHLLSQHRMSSPQLSLETSDLVCMYQECFSMHGNSTSELSVVSPKGAKAFVSEFKARA